MRDPKEGGARTMLSKFSDLLRSDPMTQSASEEDLSNSNSGASSTGSPGYYSDRSPKALSSEATSYALSPWNHATSPYFKSPWILASPAYSHPSDSSMCLLGSLVREEGHVYSLAAAGELLYTGSDSKNIRVWKGRKEFSGFKSNSGLVKAIVIAGDRIFTGHQDGKIRVWKVSPTNPTVHKRVGSLPRLRDFLRSSFNPRNYVKVRRHRNTVWLRHFDAVSCLSLDVDHGLLYSGSWDKSFKVWRLFDSKCLESVHAHDDAINSIAVGFDGLVFTGSADGTMKVWRREMTGRGGVIRHLLVQTLLRQECAVTALAVDRAASILYSGSSDGLVNVWEWRRGRKPVHRGAMRGHRLAVLCLAVAGSLVLSGSADKTICVWRRENSATHTRLAVLSGHFGPVKCLAVEEDPTSERDGGRWVVYSGSLDRSVKVWRVSEKAVPVALLLQSPLQAPVGPGVIEGYRQSKGTAGAQRAHGLAVVQEKERPGCLAPVHPRVQG